VALGKLGATTEPNFNRLKSSQTRASLAAGPRTLAWPSAQGNGNPTAARIDFNRLKITLAQTALLRPDSSRRTSTV